jgi:hypothetical protein
MHWPNFRMRPALRVQARRPLTAARLRRPTPLPQVVPTTQVGRWLLRVAGCFAGLRR